MQYTLRNVPASLDSALRQRAKAEGKSLNEAALEALARGLGYDGTAPRQRELSDIAGTWLDDPEFDAALDDQQRIDPELWPDLPR
jgi:plasmid stability protein